MTKNTSNRLSRFLALFIGAVASAQAQVTITFDDISAGSQPAEQYASRGVHFSSGSFGVVAGIANGDPGNWSLNGTAGPYFLGFNGNPSYGATVTFDSAVPTVSVDVSRSNGSSGGDTFTLTAFSGATQVATQTLSLASINVWQTATVFSSSITSVQFLGSGGGFHPYGLDNLQIGTQAIPESSTYVMLALGLVAVGWSRRRRS